MKITPMILASLLAVGSAFGQQPPKPRPLDKKFLSLAAAGIVGNAIDIYTRQRVQATNPASAEANPLLGPHPGTARMSLTLIPISIGLDVSAYEMRKSKRFNRFWLAPFAYSFQASGTGIASNLREIRDLPTAPAPIHKPPKH
jgi:hypothetical protein